MATRQNSNPFVLPGLGQSADLGQNPLMASMEMMRQAWQGLAGTGALGQSAMAASMNPEDLERRIAELQVIENWLKMNLSMLSSTIQGLEVQRATIATVKAFMGAGAPAGAAAAGHAAGVFGGAGQAAAKPGAGQEKSAPAAEAASAKGADAAQDDTRAGAPDPADLSSVQAATQGWWEMLQKQFDTLAAATAATLRAAEPETPAGGGQAKPAPKSSTAKNATAKNAAKGAARKRGGAAGKSGKADPAA